MDLRQNFLRLLALVALVAAVVVVVIVVTSSLPESDDGDAGGNRAAKEKDEKGSGEKFYIVQPGDSLSTIAEKEGIELDTLEQLNPNLDPQTLSTGQQVRLR
jgi:LysM repeat protein